MWDEITNPIPKCSGAVYGIWKWISFLIHDDDEDDDDDNNKVNNSNNINNNNRRGTIYKTVVGYCTHKYNTALDTLCEGEDALRSNQEPASQVK